MKIIKNYFTRKNKKKVAYLFFGPPGCGKGTQIELLLKENDFFHYSSGNYIRKEMKSNKKFEEKIKKGILLRDSEMFNLFKKYVNLKKNLILDGFPRTENQAYWVNGILRKNEYEIKFIHMKCDKKNLIKRIKNRMKIEKRVDDNIEVFNRRYKDQYQSIKKIFLDIYKKNLIDINVNFDIEKIFRDLKKKL